MKTENFPKNDIVIVSLNVFENKTTEEKLFESFATVYHMSRLLKKGSLAYTMFKVLMEIVSVNVFEKITI